MLHLMFSSTKTPLGDMYIIWCEHCRDACFSDVATEKNSGAGTHSFLTCTERVQPDLSISIYGRHGMVKKVCASTGLVVAALGGALLMSAPANAGDLNANTNSIENANTSANTNTNTNTASEAAEAAAAATP
jgi:hypothetical protein